MTEKLFIRLWPKSKYGLILLVIFGLALFLRIYPRLGDVFGSSWVRFGEVDPWYHIRLLENLLHHFPHQIIFDPYSFFPYGQPVEFAPFFDLMLGSIIWIIGLGSPTLHTVEVTAAYFPAILGALTVIPVFFIGKELFNKKVGLIAGALTAVLPGNFLVHSLLGMTDHHVAETLLSTVAALFLILAIKNAREKINFRDIGNRNWAKLKKPFIYALLSGLFLGIYIATWVGSLLFILIIFVYLIIQLVLDHLMGKSTNYLSIIGVPIFLVALIIIVPFLGQGGYSAMYPTSLGFAAATLTAMAALSWLMERKHLKPVYFPLASAGAVLIAIGIVYGLAPKLFIYMVRHFGIFFPQGGSTTITEVQPLFFGFESLTQNYAWGFFTTGLFIVPISLILVGYSTVKNFKAEKLFFVTWTVLMLAAMLGQNRFAYYFAVNAAILSGYFCWRIFGWMAGILRIMGFSDRQTMSSEHTKKKKGKATEKRKTSLAPKYLKVGYVSAGLATIIGFLLVFYPNISPAIDVTKLYQGPNEDWHESLLWMKDNTPDPFQDPSYFDAFYSAPPVGAPFNYPTSAYGIMSAWDYGHWITTIAHRIPNSNPHQSGAVDSASFFTAQDESPANQILDRLGSRYVIIDIDMATKLFLSNAAWIKESSTRFRETYYQANAQGILVPLIVYYPEYYQSMSSRLYNFGGEAVFPQNSSRVISYEDRTDSKGTNYKLVTSSKLFPSFEEADAYRQKTPNSRIVGTDPFVSPVPLEKLEHYQLVHASNTVVEQEKDLKISYVEMFEYRP
ncbi:MAG TPA: oligosaccharyl transferase, archaeosortase A system-associated [Dehalococcoidales bacterium]